MAATGAHDRDLYAGEACDWLALGRNFKLGRDGDGASLRLVSLGRQVVTGRTVTSVVYLGCVASVMVTAA